MDGANMNAQVGLTNPATIGADVCHLNLHKTFTIPHGGGGPNGPMVWLLTSHRFCLDIRLWKWRGSTPAVSAAPWEAHKYLTYLPCIHPACWEIKEWLIQRNMLFWTRIISKLRLESHYPILYVGSNNRVAHEMITDCRPFKLSAGIEVEDIAKRFMDYGFHAPTMSFPVPGTIMIEPTESESKPSLTGSVTPSFPSERNRGNRKRIADRKDNIEECTSHLSRNTKDEWAHSYTRKKAAFPLRLYPASQILAFGRSGRQCLRRQGILFVLVRLLKTTRKKQYKKPYLIRVLTVLRTLRKSGILLHLNPSINNQNHL